MATQDLLQLIESKMGEFSKGQKLIAEYIMHNYDKAAFMTASKLGGIAGVSESTVVRFATELGFDGYPGLQKALGELIRNRLTAVQRINVTSDQIGTTDVLDRVLSMDIDKIRKTLEETSREDFKTAVHAILHAKNIYIVGLRSASMLASFVGFYFNYIFDHVHVINVSGASEMFEQIFRMDENDLLFAISFPRYSQRTIKAIKYAKTKNAKVIALTDSKLSPLSQDADITLIARSDMASFVDSLVAPLSLVNALLVAVGMEKRTEISEVFTNLEHIWEEYDVYQKAEGKTQNAESI